MDSSFTEPTGKDPNSAKSDPPETMLPDNAYLQTGGALDSPAGNDTRGLLVNKDITTRRTKFLIDAPQRARQGVTRARRWFLLLCLLGGLLIMVAPMLAGWLVQHFFYDASQTLWELRRVANELWIVFAIPGLLLALCGLAGLARYIPVALFNLENQTVRLSEKRFQTMPFVARWARSGAELIRVDELAAVQLIHYPALHLRHKDQPLDQFELNLVLQDGSRRLVAKQAAYASLVEDATQMSLFLDIPFLDQSGQSLLY